MITPSYFIFPENFTHSIILKILSSKTDPVEIRFIRKALIKERGEEVFRRKKSPVPHPVRAIYRLSATYYSYWQFGNELPTAYTALSVAFYSLHVHTAVATAL
jgi:hypothetical protein